MRGKDLIFPPKGGPWSQQHLLYSPLFSPLDWNVVSQIKLVQVYFWLLCPFTLVNLTIPMQIPHYLNHSGIQSGLSAETEITLEFQAERNLLQEIRYLENYWKAWKNRSHKVPLNSLVEQHTSGVVIKRPGSCCSHRHSDRVYGTKLLRTGLELLFITFLVNYPFSGLFVLRQHQSGSGSWWRDPNLYSWRS